MTGLPAHFSTAAPRQTDKSTAGKSATLLHKATVEQLLAALADKFACASADANKALADACKAKKLQIAAEMQLRGEAVEVEDSEDEEAAAVRRCAEAGKPRFYAPMENEYEGPHSPRCAPTSPSWDSGPDDYNVWGSSSEEEYDAPYPS
jgi:hypothetical protein